MEPPVGVAPTSFLYKRNPQAAAERQKWSQSPVLPRTWLAYDARLNVDSTAVLAHGHEIGLPSRSHRRRLAPKVGIAPTSPPLQGGAKDEFLIHYNCGLRHEEPFTLTAKGAIFARVTFAGGDMVARNSRPNFLWLERFHGLAHTRRTTRHGSNEPFTFVVAAQEAVENRLFAGFADAQQQMTLL